MSVGAIPDPIAEIVNAEELRIAKERKEKQEKVRREENLRMERGYAYIKDYVNSKLAYVPQYLIRFFTRLRSEHPYEELMLIWGEENEKNDIGLDLVFYVPGLAPCMYEVKTGAFSCYTAKENDEEECAAWGDWPNAFRRDRRIETVLAFAKEEFEKYQVIEKGYEEQRERMRRQIAAAQAKAFEQKSMNVAIAEFDESEDQKLFNALKDDPMAVLLMRAFLNIRNERKDFEQKLDGYYSESGS